MQPGTAQLYLKSPTARFCQLELNATVEMNMWSAQLRHMHEVIGDPREPRSCALIFGTYTEFSISAGMHVWLLDLSLVNIRSQSLVMR